VYDLSNHQFEVQRFYQLESDEALAAEDEAGAVERYRALLEDSIRLRLRSDVKVGTCLSGGLDSSSIAAIASAKHAEQSEQPFAAITAASTNPANDESDYAQLVAHKSGLDWNLTKPSSDDFLKIAEELVRVQEEPFGGPSLVMQYYVFRKAKDLGCKVMLDGQGGDETLLGYERYYVAYILSLPFARAVVAFFHSSRNSRLKIRQILFYLVYFLFAGARKTYLRRRNHFLKREYLDGVSWDWLQRRSTANRDLVELQKLEITSAQLPHLLRYEDRNSMAHSIESRLPFLDYRLVELALSLPDEFKIRDGWTKYLLRKSAEPYLPTEVTWRRSKFGFDAPASDWLRDNSESIQRTIDASPLVAELTRRTTDLSDTSRWTLFFIAMWERVYEVRVA
jgi:asparagine synthase (glutamine-hydrolysing)